MHSTTFEEIKEYYFCILKVRLGKIEFDRILNDLNEAEFYKSIQDKYALLSQMPNHIHIISIVNKYRNSTSFSETHTNEQLLRSLYLLCKFQEELNADFKIKSEPEMIKTLMKLFSEYEFLNYSIKDDIY